ncbi:alpha-(1,3)-fucosyltransferase fut-1-like [Pollicipes pollicipes]|uniref:alpha-(1,3)-fucosyltransferase fut-1-like n=1 Tax=Pollicipes pollicipes TaxID=41117 RepID=UPI0018856C3D|nr:alpha-(1,3)-fucosyltransferase fut-1-like [Pollicipes pollicipes]
MRVRAAAWVVSHCSTHSKREEYVQKLARHLVVDIYGRCGTLKCPSDQGGGRNAEACYRTLAASHFFYLSFENSLCEDYITEKFWHALRAGIVPVVRGASPESYRRVAPPNSFIHVQDFASVQLLATYLTSLMENRTAYESYFAWRSSYQVHGLHRGRASSWPALSSCLQIRRGVERCWVNTAVSTATADNDTNQTLQVLGPDQSDAFAALAAAARRSTPGCSVRCQENTCVLTSECLRNLASAT